MLIHGFSPVNARLLIVYGTAFYAITNINVWGCAMALPVQSYKLVTIKTLKIGTPRLVVLNIKQFNSAMQ